MKLTTSFLFYLVLTLFFNLPIIVNKLFIHLILPELEGKKVLKRQERSSVLPFGVRGRKESNFQNRLPAPYPEGEYAAPTKTEETIKANLEVEHFPNGVDKINNIFWKVLRGNRNYTSKLALSFSSFS
jgi:hypothetical protein